MSHSPAKRILMRSNGCNISVEVTPPNYGAIILNKESAVIKYKESLPDIPAIMCSYFM